MIKLELPIYVDVSNKKKKLMSMNWYRNAHFQEESKVKRYYKSLIKALLERPKLKITGFVSVRYSLYYKNSKSDLMNVVSVLDKYLMDALQENDNVLNYRKCSIEVAGQDKENPRLICVITGEKQ